jgi:hypothetical protein
VENDDEQAMNESCGEVLDLGKLAVNGGEVDEVSLRFLEDKGT